MLDIHHRLIVNAPPDEVFTAVTHEVLSSVSALGVVITRVDVERESTPPRSTLPTSRTSSSSSSSSSSSTLASARVLDGPADWIGTEIVIDVGASPEGTGTVVRLSHRYWRDCDRDAMAANTTRWGQVLLGLKKRVEMPDPTDLGGHF